MNCEAILIEPTVTIGKGAIIKPGVMLTGTTTIGDNGIIRPGAVLHDTIVGDEGEIGANWALHKYTAGQKQKVAPLGYHQE